MSIFRPSIREVGRNGKTTTPRSQPSGRPQSSGIIETYFFSTVKFPKIVRRLPSFEVVSRFSETKFSLFSTSQIFVHLRHALQVKMTTTPEIIRTNPSEEPFYSGKKNGKSLRRRFTFGKTLFCLSFLL